MHSWRPPPRVDPFRKTFCRDPHFVQQWDGQHAHWPSGLVYKAVRLFQFGFWPLATAFDVFDLSLNDRVRAAAGHPLKARKPSLWVPEHTSMLTSDAQPRLLVSASRTTRASVCHSAHHWGVGEQSGADNRQ